MGPLCHCNINPRYTYTAFNKKINLAASTLNGATSLSNTQANTLILEKQGNEVSILLNGKAMFKGPTDGGKKHIRGQSLALIGFKPAGAELKVRSWNIQSKNTGCPLINNKKIGWLPTAVACLTVCSASGSLSLN